MSRLREGTRSPRISPSTFPGCSQISKLGEPTSFERKTPDRVGVAPIVMKLSLSFPSRPRLAALAHAILLTIVAAPATAHVALDAPNGGEVLDPGTVFTIVWHDSIYHGPANYDLWYSTTGPEGPWISIVRDITPGFQMPSYSYEWTVPDAPSTRVRLFRSR